MREVRSAKWRTEKVSATTQEYSTYLSKFEAFSFLLVSIYFSRSLTPAGEKIHTGKAKFQKGIDIRNGLW